VGRVAIALLGASTTCDNACFDRRAYDAEVRLGLTPRLGTRASGVPDASPARLQNTHCMSHALLRPSASERFRSLVDGLIESWVCWREARKDVRNAYDRWGQRGPGGSVYSMHVERVREVSA